MRLFRVTPVILILAACGKAEKPAEQAAAAPVEPRVVHVTVTDYAFQAPDTLPSGLTSFHMMNNGKELHHLVLLKLAPGQTVADLAGVNMEGPLPPGMIFMGGPNAPVPGGSAESLVDLKTGQYALLCIIPSPVDMKPHVAKGMIRPLTVIAGETVAAAPTPDLTITLSDYDFALSGPVSAGKHIIKIENTAEQPHELLLVKLEPGKTVADVAKWSEKMQGPPPGVPFGGITPISTGINNIVTVELAPGEYGLLCFVTDAKDGKLHILHGMVKQFTVS
ncbi:MAG: hypothetical protein HOP28_18430 [Gemmatimonadales bacterium]|nr:hypothetical protein [Gemmatimonadales bacterium]